MFFLLYYTDIIVLRREVETAVNSPLATASEVQLQLTFPSSSLCLAVALKKGFLFLRARSASRRNKTIGFINNKPYLCEFYVCFGSIQGGIAWHEYLTCAAKQLRYSCPLPCSEPSGFYWRNTPEQTVEL